MPLTDPTPAPATSASGRGGLALAGLALIWGYQWVVMKVALRSCDPFTFAALRPGLAAVLLLVLMRALGRPLRPRALGLTLLVGLFQTTGFIGLMTWALAEAGAGRVSVLTYTMPFWLLLLAWLFLGERLRGVQWVAVGLAFAGLLLVLGPWQLRGVTSSLLAVAGGLSWAAGTVVAKYLQRRHPVDLLSLTTWQMVLGSIPLAVIAALTWSGSPAWTPAFAVSLAYVVILGNALAWFLWLHAVRVLPAGKAGLGTLAIPVIGVVAAWIQLGERPAGLEAVGMAAIVVALAIVALRRAGPAAK